MDFFLLACYAAHLLRSDDYIIALSIELGSCCCLVVVPWGRSMRTHNTGVVSSIPPRVTIETKLVGKGTGNQFIDSISLEEAQSLVSGFCYARNRVCNAVLLGSLI